MLGRVICDQRLGETGVVLSVDAISNPTGDDTGLENFANWVVARTHVSRVTCDQIRGEPGVVLSQRR